MSELTEMVDALHELGMKINVYFDKPTAFAFEFFKPSSTGFVRVGNACFEGTPDTELEFSAGFYIGINFVPTEEITAKVAFKRMLETLFVRVD